MIKKIKYSLDEDACYYYWVDDALVGPYENPEKALDKFISHISTCTEYNEPNIKYKLLDSAVAVANELERKDIKYKVVDKEYDEVLEEKEELQKRYDKLLEEYDKTVKDQHELEDELQEIKTQHEMCSTALEKECGDHMRTRQKYDKKRKEFNDLLNCHNDVCQNHSSLLEKVNTLKERYE